MFFARAKIYLMELLKKTQFNYKKAMTEFLAEFMTIFKMTQRTVLDFITAVFGSRKKRPLRGKTRPLMGLIWEKLK